MPDRTTIRLALVCLLAAALTAGTAAQALTINLAAVEKGKLVPFFDIKAMAGPAAYTGTGSLKAIMRSAEKSWEGAISDPHRTNVHYAWGKLEDGVLGSTMRSGNRAAVVFNRNYDWFIDKTPGANEEFKATRKEYKTVIGKRMTVGIYNPAKPSREAARAYDLLTVARHEVAHAINAWFHAIYDNALLAPELPKGMRRDISSADAYLTAEYAGYTGPKRFDVLAPVPLPGGLPLVAGMLGAFGALAGLRRRRGRA